MHTGARLLEGLVEAHEGRPAPGPAPMDPQRLPRDALRGGPAEDDVRLARPLGLALEAAPCGSSRRALLAFADAARGQPRAFRSLTTPPWTEPSDTSPSFFSASSGTQQT